MVGVLIRQLYTQQANAEKIYAFEPDLINLPKVEKQVENMQLKNVDIIPAGMWNCKDILRFQSQGTIKSKLDERGDVEVNVVALSMILYLCPCIKQSQFIIRNH